MKRVVYIVSDPHDNERLLELVSALEADGLSVMHNEAVGVGDSLIGTATKHLRGGIPVVLCATVHAVARPWARKLVNAAQSIDGSKVLVVEMDEGLDLDHLSLNTVAARYYADPVGAMDALMAALHAYFPEDSDEPTPLTFDGQQEFLDQITTAATPSIEALAEFREQLREDIAAEYPQSLSAGEFLQRTYLVREGRLTRTGVLLVGEKPAQIMPSAVIECCEYHGTDRTAASTKTTIFGTLQSQIVQANKYIADRVQRGEAPSPTGPYAQPVYAYPMIAIREIIANAIAHRNYSAANSCIHIRIFEDRIEVTNPGMWIGREIGADEPQRIDGFAGESSRRNFRLASMLTWIRLVEGEGKGILAMATDCRAVEAPIPTVRESDGIITVTVFPRADASSIQDFLKRYKGHVVERHGKLEPPDFERRRRMPLADSYVSPSITSADSNPARTMDIWQFDEEIDHAVLLGDPGSGKTTACNVLMHKHASDDQARIPFLVTLRDFAAQNPPERSVIGYIEHMLETFYQCPAPPGAIQRLLLAGNVLVIFDGLDELLDASRRGEVSARIELFCAEYPHARVLVTSRRVGYDQARLDDRLFDLYWLGGFGDDQVREFAHKWFAQEVSASVSEAEAFLNESLSVPDLRANPLLLSLMCILYRGEGSLPRNRAEMYEQCADLLFRRWDMRRHIHQELRAGSLVEPALRHLAWWLFTREELHSAVTELELVREVAVFLHDRGFESDTDAREAAAEFVEFCRGRMWVFTDMGTTATGENLYSFTHRTFLEYFAAAQLAVDSNSPESLARSLAPKITNQKWETVGELSVHIIDRMYQRGAERVITALLDDRRYRRVEKRARILEFARKCSISTHLPPSIMRRIAE